MIGGISVTQLLILLLIVMLVFGTKRLRNIGSDLGNAVKGFRKGIEDEDSKPEKNTTEENAVVEPQTKEDKATASRPTDADV